MVFRYGSVRLAALMLFAVLSFGVGCGAKSDPSDPEGAYNLYRDALFAGDADGVWNRLSEDSKVYFEEQLSRLRLMDEKIVRYLPPTDHKLARKQAGSILTDDLKDGHALFVKIFSPNGLPKDEQYLVGSNVEEIRVSEDEKTAEVVTRGKQTIRLVHDQKSDAWFVSFPESTDQALKGSLKWLDDNESALDQTIEDLIDEERRQREKVIADLLGLDAEKTAN